MARRMARAVRGVAALAAAGLLGACAAPAGRYYAHDGPPAPDKVPAGLAAQADAVPRVEALHPYANRPYQALGRTYTPDTSDTVQAQTGIASWYGRQYHGNRTASGEPYDMFAMSAAHPTLPIPSYARVTRLDNGQSVIVRVNDRGPFLYDRIIDLSYGAAVRLDMARAGSVRVRVERLTNAQIAGAAVPAAPAASAPALDAEDLRARAALEDDSVSASPGPAGSAPAGHH
jgi:rare lipoprotein A